MSGGSPKVVPGTSLGNYQVQRLLGRGGMGAVYLANDATLHRRVALKVVDEVVDSETSRMRLLREARNAAALNHPNICTIHEVGDEGGMAFIAMEYVEGRSLREQLDEGRLRLDDALRYGVQAADALSYAHEHGVVHRDFKAGNAIATADGRLKIVDFGLARRGDASMAEATTVASLVPAGTQAGTPYAMAPEQVRGQPADERTDIWALGVLLYEMVAGVRPFSGATTPELFSSILRDRPAPLPADVATELAAIVGRCLEKDASQRFQSASEVREALQSVVQILAAGPAAGWRRRATRTRLLTAAGVVLATAAMLSVWILGDFGGPPAGGAPTASIKLAVLPFENLTGDPEQEYFSDGLTEEMITQLGRLHPQRLGVIARTSSMRYKDSNATIEQIGRELGVEYVLEGSARREGSRVRISATLIQVDDQTQRWADTFESELSGVLALQSNLALGVAKSLALTLLPAEEARLANIRDVDPEAYEATLKGRSHLNRLTPADIDAAEQYFQLALEKDPNYALAHVGISSVWAGRQQMGFVSPREAAPLMKSALERALELDGNLQAAQGRWAGHLTWTDWDWAAADAQFQHALTMGPNDADTRAFYSHFLYIMKRPSEAEQQIRRALELDPLSMQVQALYGRDLVHARRLEEAVLQFRRVLQMNPDSPQALNNLAEVHFILRQYDEALTAEMARWKARGDGEILEALVRGRAESDYQGALRTAADALAARSQSTHVPSVDLAGMYVRAGLSDRALDWLERSFDLRDPMLPYISIHPIYDGIRDSPRFIALLRRMNLPGD